MTTNAALHTSRSRTGRIAVASGRAGAVLALALLLGGLTSWGQFFLPTELHSVANSSGGWTIFAAALVLFFARSVPEGAIEGGLAFIALPVGYTVVSNARGFEFDPTYWAIVGFVTGPVVGTAAHALRRGGLAPAIGAAVISGILIGEGAYGLTLIATTTSPVWWWIQIGVGLAVLVATGIRSSHPQTVGVAAGATGVVVCAFWLGYVVVLPALT